MTNILHINKLLAAISGAILLCGCSGETGLRSIPRPVDLTMEIGNKSLIIGDELVLSFNVNDDRFDALQEEIDIRLKASKGTEDASAFFTEFPSKVVFREGESRMEVRTSVAGTVTGTSALTIEATSRGYTIDGASQTINVSDYRYVSMSIENNTDNSVREGDSFVLLANLGTPATEDMKINISAGEGEDEYYENLPESVTIAAGESSAKTPAITLASDGGAYDNVELTLTFSPATETFRMSNSELKIKRIDIDEPLGTLLGDERHVYTDPSVSFVSSGYVQAVENWGGAKYIVAEEGVTPHPNAELAAAGWNFYHAMEFHYIDAMLFNNLSITENKPNAFGNYQPHGFANQNTAKVQTHTAAIFERFTSITPDGYLRMWSAKGTFNATGGGAGVKNYGTAALFSSKFNANNATNKPMHTRIYPGMRMEARIRTAGATHGFNPAFWLQGNSNTDGTGTPWPTCGEIDILENPNGNNAGGDGKAWQTFHVGDAAGNEVNSCKNTSGALDIDMEKWNIFWMEWSGDGNTVTLGINGQTNTSLTRAQVEAAGGVWPFDKTANPNGLHLLLTFVGPDTWALGNTIPDGWDVRFADISYEDSKTSSRTPQMLVDWIRYYTDSSYSTDGKAFSQYKFY